MKLQFECLSAFSHWPQHAVAGRRAFQALLFINCFFGAIEPYRSLRPKDWAQAERRHGSASIVQAHRIADGRPVAIKFFASNTAFMAEQAFYAYCAKLRDRVGRSRPSCPAAQGQEPGHDVSALVDDFAPVVVEIVPGWTAAMKVGGERDGCANSENGSSSPTGMQETDKAPDGTNERARVSDVGGRLCPDLHEGPPAIVLERGQFTLMVKQISPAFPCWVLIFLRQRNRCIGHKGLSWIGKKEAMGAVDSNVDNPVGMAGGCR